MNRLNDVFFKKCPNFVSMYKLDRTAFKAQSFEEADNQVNYWLQQPPAERLRAATYLIYSAWNLDPDNPPRLDREAFSMRCRISNRKLEKEKGQP